MPARRWDGFSDACGCVATDAVCEDPRDLRVTYLAHDPEVCAVIDYACPPDETGFTNDCGCLG